MGPRLARCSLWGCCLGCICGKEAMVYWRGRTRVWAPPIGDPESPHGLQPHSFYRRASPIGNTRSGSPGRVRRIFSTRRRSRNAHDDEAAQAAPESGDRGGVDPGDVSSASLRSNRRSQYSVFAARLSIMVMLTVLIGVLTILTWHFTTVYTTRSIETLAYNLRMDILERPVNRVRTVLNITLAVTVAHNNLAKYVFSRHPDPGEQDEIYSAMRNVTWALFASQQTVSNLQVVYNNGLNQGYERDDDSPLSYYAFSLPANASAASPSTSPALSPTGSSSDPSVDFVEYAASDAFVWYKQVVEDHNGPRAVGAPVATGQAGNNLIMDFSDIDILEPGDIGWHATVHRSSSTPFLAAGSAVRDPLTGRVQAITGTTQDLSSVNTLMKQLVRLHSGTMYIITVSGFLLASSTDAPLVQNTSNGTSLIMAEECDDPIIRSGSIWLKKAYGNSLPTLQNVHRENIVLLGDKYYIDTFVLNLTRLPLVGVIVTPRSSVLGAVDRRGRATLAILLSISGCFLLAGCLCTLIFTTGVSNEMKLRLELISHLDARRRAEASSTYKSQFLANMSHELRTPMAAVIGLLDILLCDEYMTSEQVAMVSQIRQCATALLRLLNNILDLSKVESGKLVLEDADFDLRRELEGVVDMFSVQCPDQQIEFVLDLSDDLPPMLRGDSARVVQIFANLIANSIKFTSSGHVVVRARCESSHSGGSCGRSGLLYSRGDRDSGSGVLDVPYSRSSTQHYAEANEDEYQHPSDHICVAFEVDDTGCGIDPSKWETVFDSFVQADPSTTRTYGGTGLGLCIVRSLVQKMGGEIKVARKDGPGTLLKFFLHFKQAQETPLRKPPDDLSTTLFFDTLLQSKLVFSLQGDTGRTLMTRWMTERGLLVSDAADWEETIAELDELVLHEDDGLPKLQLLAILDFGLVPKTDALDELDKYVKKGVLIGWLLNHDTSSNGKSDLRKRGYSVMANKPVFKSKLINMLKLLSGSNKDMDRLSSTEPDLLQRAGSFRYDANHPFKDGQVVLPIKHSRSPSSGRLEQVSEQGSQEELRPGSPNSNVRRSSSLAHFPIFKPTNYLQPEFIGTAKTKSRTDAVSKVGAEESASERGSAQLSNPEISHMSQPDNRLNAIGAMDSTERGPLLSPLEEPLRTDAEFLRSGEAVGPGNHQISIQGPAKLQESAVAAAVSADKERAPDNNAEPQKREVAAKEIGTLDETCRSVEEASFLPETEHMKARTRVETPPIMKDGANGVLEVDPQKGIQESSSSDAVTAPASPTNSAAASSSQMRKAQVSSAASRFGPRDALKGITILLAEDTPVLQRVATMMLERLGAKVVPVADGLQAVNALTTSLDDEATDVERPSRVLKYPDPALLPFDLVLMDCQMPKMDGYDATRAIREAERGTNCHIPIVALTAHAMSSDEAKCLEVGMDAYLTKPIDQKLMMSTITSFTKGRPKS